MLIIPAIDIRGGKCVRLIQGDYQNERVYDADPLDVALQFADAGAMLIHVVDLDGAKVGKPQNWAVIERLAKDSRLPIEFGGGVRSLETARKVLGLGIARVVVGTQLVKDEQLSGRLFAELGAQMVAGLDSREGMVATEGWLGQSQVPAVELARRVERQGAARIILTDIARDGMLNGPNTELLAETTSAVSIPVIQSGGIGSIEDLEILAHLSPPPEGAITGRALYEGKLNLKEACSRFQ